jgi:NTP pyrophosphatase (non-canonical NTP hydrolase)
MMDFYEYQDAVLKTLGPDADPRSLALGVGGEAGEVMEIIKKAHRPGRSVDVEHLKEELGDVLWYVAALASHYNISLPIVAEHNIQKLKERYGTVHSKATT